MKLNSFWPAALLLVAALAIVAKSRAQYTQTLQADGALAYWTLSGPSSGVTENSVIGSFTATYENGAGNIAAGPQFAGLSTGAANLNGVNSGSPQYLTTNFGTDLITGGTGSMAVWINPTAAVQNSGIYYISGISNNGNDWDLQIIGGTTPTVTWYTDSGNDVSFDLPSGAIGSWNQIAVTSSGSNYSIYWDGTLEASASNGEANDKTGDLTIGYSSVFGNRDFAGSIADLAVFDTSLSSSQVSGLYNSAFVASSGSAAVPEPATYGWIAAAFLIGLVAWRRGFGHRGFAAARSNSL